MARIHLFELEDQPWFPVAWRNYGTDFLQTLAEKVNMYAPVVPLITKALKKNGETTIVDLASGGGGGLPSIAGQLQQEVPGLKIILTDYFPNIPAFKAIKKKNPEVFDYVEEQVDATHVPVQLQGLRTMFASFHHFRPGMARQILQNAVDSHTSIAIFEGAERSLISFLAMLFSPLTVLLITPFIRPFSFWRLLFTYLVPVIPLFVLWDGMVSALRIYSVQEMEELVSSLKNKERFDWQTGRLRKGPGVILYLIGTRR
jgi:hypothetical protein